MKDYEMTLIVDGSTSEEDANKVAQAICAIVTDNGGKIHSFDSWGRRKLAYSIRKKSHGYYFIIFYQDEGQASAKIQRQIAIDDFALKCLILNCADVKAEQEFFQQLKANPNLNQELYRNYQQKD